MRMPRTLRPDIFNRRLGALGLRGLIAGLLCLAVFGLGLPPAQASLTAPVGVPLPVVPVEPALQPAGQSVSAQTDFSDADFSQADQAELGAARGGAARLTDEELILVIVGAVLLLILLIILIA